MSFFLQLVFNGLAIGAVYALIAAGYSLVYGTLEFVNFAHGDVCIAGAYVAYWAIVSLGHPVAVALGLAVIAGGTVGVVIDRLAYHPLRNAPRLMPLISAMGVSIILQNVIAMIFGSTLRNPGFALPAITTITFSGATLPGADIAMLVVAIVVTVGLFLIIHATRIGLAVRAVASDREAAEVLGIRAEMIVSFTFFLSSAVGTIGGLMVASQYGLTPTMGILIGFKAFTACVVGGMRSLPGVIVAALSLGVIENVAAGYLSAEYKDAYAFLILVGALLIRPQGLLTRRTKRAT